MVGIQVTIKNVDEQAFSELKAEAARIKLPVGRAMSLAIKNWISQSRKPSLQFGKWKTIKGGSKTKLLSEQVDSVLYG